MEMKRIGILDMIKIPRQMLLITGMWPKRSSTKFYALRNPMLIVMDVILYMGFFIDVYLDITKKNYKHLTELFSIMASMLSYQWKRYLIMKNSVHLLDAIDDLEKDVFKNNPGKTDVYVEKQMKFLTIWARTFQLVILCLMILLFLRPFFSKDDTAILFAAYDLGRWRLAIHIFQIWCIFWGTWNNIHFDILISGLMSISTSQFEVLGQKLTKVKEWAGLTYQQIDAGIVNDIEAVNVELDESVDAMLGECVEHHLGIIKFSADLEGIFNVYFLVQFSASVLAICNTWFQLRLSDDMISMLFLVCYTFALVIQLFIYCFYGNQLIVQSEEIRDACYFSDWYLCGPRAKKSLIIIMERAKRSTVLTAGNLAELSLASFASLMRSSFSYFTIMNTLYDQ